jgi:hypothetical protein
MLMHLRAAVLLLMFAAAARADRPGGGDPLSAASAPAPGKVEPVMTGSSAIAAAVSAPDLVIFKGTRLLNEFVYRAILRLPPDATATPLFARSIATTLAAFLRDAGYDLAKVRAQVKGEQIEVDIDEGALDKVIVAGTGWITALRFRNALDLPLDVFNRRAFERQMPRLAKRFGFKGYRFELWPVQLIDKDNALFLNDVEELRAMPLIRPARGYELRIFAETEKWGSGFSPEILLNGRIGTGLGGRYRWKNLIQQGDRWQAHFRVGGALRSPIDPNGSSYLVNTNDYLTTRWLSKSWDGSSRGLRMTIAPRAELWSLQRKDLMLEGYRIGTLELGTGAGAQLRPELSLFFTLGMQRRWIFDLKPGAGGTLIDEVTRVPAVSWRGFLRANTVYTFNPSELRQDLRNELAVELNLFRPTVAQDKGYVRLDFTGRKLFPLGWNELRASIHFTGELGDVAYVDEIPLADHLRIGSLDKYTKRATSVSLEFRYSLLRDKFKVGVFNDIGVWRHLVRDDTSQAADLAGSSGAGAFFFLFDELQVDVFYGVGWSTTSSVRPGLALAIKEAF